MNWRSFLGKLNIDAIWKDDSQGNFVGASFKYDNLSITGNAAGFTATDLRKHFSGEKPCVEKFERIPEKVALLSSYLLTRNGKSPK